MTAITRDAEVDRFGRWVVAISEEDPPPPLFLPYLRRVEKPLIGIKIPRRIDRRDVRPGMNLYDYQVNLYEQEVEVLQRANDQVQHRCFRYTDVQYLRFGKELLKGTLYVQLRDGAFDIRFNTVSERIMRHLVTIIRQRYITHVTSNVPVQDAGAHRDRLSFYFSGLLNTLKSVEPETRILALQPTVPIGQLEQTRARRLFYGVISKTLLESMHLTNGCELTIIDRGRAYKYGWQSIYGSSTCTIPLDRIQGASWQADNHNKAIVHLRIDLPGSAISMPFLANNPSLHAYRQYLTAVANRPLVTWELLRT